MSHYCSAVSVSLHFHHTPSYSPGDNPGGTPLAAHGDAPFDWQGNTPLNHQGSAPDHIARVPPGAGGGGNF